MGSGSGEVLGTGEAGWAGFILGSLEKRESSWRERAVRGGRQGRGRRLGVGCSYAMFACVRKRGTDGRARRSRVAEIKGCRELLRFLRICLVVENSDSCRLFHRRSKRRPPFFCALSAQLRRSWRVSAWFALGLGGRLCVFPPFFPDPVVSIRNVFTRKMRRNLPGFPKLECLLR